MQVRISQRKLNEGGRTHILMKLHEWLGRISVVRMGSKGRRNNENK